MTDLELAKNNLVGHAVCFAKDGKIIVLDGRGVAPLLKIIDEKCLDGFSVADRVVGKAAAMLFAKMGIKAVCGKVMSKAGKSYLESKHIVCECESLVDKIINRAGTDICPMEKTVQDVFDEDEAYLLLARKVEELRSAK